MEENEFMLKLVAMLDMAKSKKQVNSDIKELEKVVKNLRLTATLLKGKSKQEINQVIKQFEGQLIVNAFSFCAIQYFLYLRKTRKAA